MTRAEIKESLNVMANSPLLRGVRATVTLGIGRSVDHFLQEHVRRGIVRYSVLRIWPLVDMLTQGEDSDG